MTISDEITAIVGHLGQINARLVAIEEQRAGKPSRYKCIDYSYSLAVEDMKHDSEHRMCYKESIDKSRYIIIAENLRVFSENFLDKDIWCDTLIESTTTGKRYFTCRKFLVKV